MIKGFGVNIVIVLSSTKPTFISRYKKINNVLLLIDFMDLPRLTILNYENHQANGSRKQALLALLTQTVTANVSDLNL